MRWPHVEADTPPLTVINPGRLIGDLTVITGQVRQTDLVATEPSKFLRIGAEEFRTVIESDPSVAVQLLETMGGHLSSAANRLRAQNLDNDQMASMTSFSTKSYGGHADA